MRLYCNLDFNEMCNVGVDVRFPFLPGHPSIWNDFQDYNLRIRQKLFDTSINMVFHNTKTGFHFSLKLPAKTLEYFSTKELEEEKKQEIAIRCLFNFLNNRFKTPNKIASSNHMTVFEVEKQKTIIVEEDLLTILQREQEKSRKRLQGFRNPSNLKTESKIA